MQPSQEPELPRFELGRTTITRAADEVLSRHEVLMALKRHVCRDWGNVDAEDTAANNQALRDGSRLLSTYEDAKGTKFWIITEADRSATTVLLPEDY